jgi:hypothetical protein
LGRSVWKTCIFGAEVAEKRAFFRWKWLKNVRFSGGSGWKMCVFFRWKCLKNVCFLGRSGWKTCVFQVEVAEKRAFFRWK